MSQHTVDGDAAEFHIVVRRANPHGPLAPYRLGLAVAFATLLAGEQLWDALMGSASIDDAMLRALVTGMFMWIVSGVINKALTVRDERSMALPSGSGNHHDDDA